MVKLMGKEFILGQVARSMMESGLMLKSKDMVFGGDSMLILI